MGTLDPRVDAYIAKSADFARPILVHLRETIHAASPVIDETLKWSAPHFAYQGMFCGFAAFNEHVGFGFWKAALLEEHLPGPGGMSSAGQFGDARRAHQDRGWMDSRGQDSQLEVRQMMDADRKERRGRKAEGGRLP